jgi:hypothetical protein
MVKARLFLSILLGLISTSTYAGIYQRTRHTHVLIWNDHPNSFQEVTWSGGKDSAGYATGDGTLTWYAPEKPPLTGSTIPSRRKMVVISSESGTMEHGKFVSQPKGGKRSARVQREESSPAPTAEQATKDERTSAKGPSPTASASPSTTATPRPFVPQLTPAPSPSPRDESINSLTRPPSSLQLNAPAETPHPTESASPSP